jgi:hypothetical protein
VKLALLGLFVAGSIMSAGAALAGTADDAKWIAQCVNDNKNEKAPSAEVIVKYCTCMTMKMDENETKSVSQWEKTHKDEEKQCDAESGWK